MKRIVIVSMIGWLGLACATTAPQPSPSLPEKLHGTASWYGQEFAGRTTANGEIFDPMLMTAAHRTLPFGTLVDVKNPKTGQTVRVRINDRGPFVGNRMIDLSYAAAQQISLVEPGSGDVDVTVVSIGKGEHEPPAPYSVAIGTTPGGASVPAAPVTPASPTAVAEAPRVDFPLPAATTSSSTISSTTTIVQTPAVDTRRQVGATGTTIESVPLVSPVSLPVTGATPNATTTTTTTTVTTTVPTIAPVPPVSSTTEMPPPAATTAEELDAAEHPITSEILPEKKPDHPSAPGHSAAASLDATHREPVAPAPRKPAHSGKYIVQVGAFSIEANAKVLQERLTRLGEHPYTDKTSLWRVRLGPFANKEQAIKAREHLESNGISAIIVTE